MGQSSDRLTDVEISRAINAVSATLRDQRPERFDSARVEQIALGAIAGEPKLRARATGSMSGELVRSRDGQLIASIELRDGSWTVERRMRAGDSSWALPQPAADRAAAGEASGEQ